MASDLPAAVLFACGHNAVRSPMAGGLMRHFFGHKVFVASCGVHTGELDPFAVAVMDELGIDISGHSPTSFEDLEDTLFDLIVSLTPEAHHAALELTRTQAVAVEYWPTLDPTLIAGNREQRLQAYREVRDGLMRHIQDRFGMPAAPVV
ncbi:arsenate reductase ArsC [Kaustia mangrovi]|uniref:Arsenate reductase ArsC n=1 Tax=Kaustia mangrovi TaxID=2593653 RepID=A0A7S8HBT4_9HYPH|nr:arsenate reductase ArsC [Kaustia mangrovi]QPC42538.1 arsenate reductase ArsC [Kaustia mangrovi]